MRILKYIFAVLILGSLGLAIFSYIKSTQLPDKNLIIDPLYLEPVQKEVDIYTKPFEIKKQGFTYIITPLYEYEVFGLSVADYDSENWLDVFYKKDPLNTKDICLIWGDNIKNGFYKDIEFRQREFVCSWKLKKQNVIFSNNKISSNHLLPANNDIYNEFKQA